MHAAAVPATARSACLRVRTRESKTDQDQAIDPTEFLVPRTVVQSEGAGGTAVILGINRLWGSRFQGSAPMYVHDMCMQGGYCIGVRTSAPSFRYRPKADRHTQAARNRRPIGRLLRSRTRDDV